MDDERLHDFWKGNDRDGYIEAARRFRTLSDGSPMIPSVASRWFNLNSIITSTAGDLWVHREKDELWDPKQERTARSRVDR